MRRHRQFIPSTKAVHNKNSYHQKIQNNDVIRRWKGALSKAAENEHKDSMLRAILQRKNKEKEQENQEKDL